MGGTHGTNTLVVAGEETVAHRIADASAGADSVVLVSYSESFDAGAVAGDSASLTVVQARWDGRRPLRGATVTATTPDDLVGVGRRASTHIGNCEGECVVCLDAVDALHRYAGLAAVYGFLHVLTRHVAAADATGVYGCAPDALDGAALGTLAQLFDTVVDIEATATGV
jgi:hypothetical protein